MSTKKPAATHATHAAAPAVHSSFIELEHVRALPELEAGKTSHAPVFGPNAVERFLDSDEARVMAVVVGTDGLLYKQVAPFQG